MNFDQLLDYYMEYFDKILQMHIILCCIFLIFSCLLCLSVERKSVLAKVLSWNISIYCRLKRRPHTIYWDGPISVLGMSSSEI